MTRRTSSMTAVSLYWAVSTLVPAANKIGATPAQIYNPVANSWSSIPNFPQSQFGDDPLMLLPNGSVLVGYPERPPTTYIYIPTSNTWSQAATKLDNDASDEEAWVKLPDNSILSYDVFDNGQAQCYIPSQNQWVETGSVPVSLSSSMCRVRSSGLAFLLPDCRASSTWVATAIPRSTPRRPTPGRPARSSPTVWRRLRSGVHDAQRRCPLRR